jgi:hypothetical protein
MSKIYKYVFQQALKSDSGSDSDSKKEDEDHRDKRRE